MKKKAIVAAVVFTIVTVAAGLWIATNGVSVGTIDIGGGERRWLEARTYDFVEDLQFKDFDKASTYHLKSTQKERDIPALIQRAFHVKHEMLDILRWEILEVDLDRSKARGRVRVKIWYRILGGKVITKDERSRRELELLFYWFRIWKIKLPIISPAVNWARLTHHFI